MPVTLTLKRDSVIAELRRMPFDVTLDGATAAAIEHHGSFETTIEPGRHTLQVRAGRYTSPAESFDVADGDAVNFLFNGAKFWPIYLISLLVPNIGLNLKRERL